MELNSAGWAADRGAGAQLVITLTGLTVPIPKILNVIDGLPYQAYPFTVSTAAAPTTPGGSYNFQTLKSSSLDANGRPVNASPHVKVGNIDSDDALSTVSTQDVYVGDEHSFTITLKAAGPIYNVDANNDGDVEDSGAGDINAQIAVNLNTDNSTSKLKMLPFPLPKTYTDISTDPDTVTQIDPPPALTPAHVTQLNENLTTDGKNTGTSLTIDGVPRTSLRSRAGYGLASFVEVTKKSGTVSFGTPKISISNNTATINIVKMDVGAEVVLTYHKVWAQAATGDDENLFGVTVTSDSTTSAAEEIGEIKTRGGGKLEVDKKVVEVNASFSSLTLTYTADTPMKYAYLAVRIPRTSGDNPTHALKMPEVGNDTNLVNLTLTADGYSKAANLGDGPLNSPYGSIKMTSVSHNTSEDKIKATQTLIDTAPGADLNGDGDNTNDYDLFIWGPLFLPKGGTVKGTISKVKITGVVGDYDWTSSIAIVPSPATRPIVLGSGTLTAVPLCVLQAGDNPTDPDVTFEISSVNSLRQSTLGSTFESSAGVGGFGFYDANGRYRFKFTFTAQRTSVKQGKVTFTLPSGWSPPTTTPGKEGYIKLDGPGTLDKPSGRTITISKLDLDHTATTAPVGNTVSVIYGANSGPADAATDDMIGALIQPDAGIEKITGFFDVDGDGSIARQASNELQLTVGNVKAGSGKATISPQSVEAGGVVDLTVTFTAQGTMDGGQVVLKMPDGWGDLQQTTPPTPTNNVYNYVQVASGNGGTLVKGDESNTSNDIVVANLNTFKKGSTVRFTLNSVIAQPTNLGIANFTIYSAGKWGEPYVELIGEMILPDGAYSNAGVDLPKLLGRVYTTDCIDDGAGTGPDDYNGLLRVAVTGGGDGAGQAAVSIEASENSGDYVINGETKKGIKQVHAGDGAKTHLRFIYTPIETITTGALRLIIPSGWTAPQTTNATNDGFIQATSDGSVGNLSISGHSVTLPLHLVNESNTVTIDYGAIGRAAPSTTAGDAKFYRCRLKDLQRGALKILLDDL